MNQPIHIADLPILRPGDRMDRDEFERRWDAMSHLKHAELIDGVVYMPSPTSLDHGDAHGMIAIWFAQYIQHTPLVKMSITPSVRMDQRNQPEPDMTLRITSANLQRSVREGNLLRGAPELVVEVSITSAAHDRGAKRDLYERMGVQEYLIYRPEEQLLEWFHLRDGSYQPLTADSNGIFRSEVFPGLWLNSQGLIEEAPSLLLQSVQQGITTPEHAAFVARLQAAAAQPETPS